MIDRIQKTSGLIIILIMIFCYGLVYNISLDEIQDNQESKKSNSESTILSGYEYKPNTQNPSYSSNTPGTRATDEPLIISSDQHREFKNDGVFSYVEIRDDATMIIRDCEFRINGTLTIKGNSRLFIMNSTVYIAPGPVGPQEIIINILDNARVIINDSWIFTLPQPTMTNISYLLSDDNSEVIIIRSYINAKLPGIVNIDIELTPPNAGTFILTGETIWNINNCSIESWLYFDENIQEKLF